jgi:predicted RNase H-like HicB family nuclease
MSLELTAVFQQVPEGFIAFVEELPGANSQGATLEEARSNLHEAVMLVLEANTAANTKSNPTPNPKSTMDDRGPSSPSGLGPLFD